MITLNRLAPAKLLFDYDEIDHAGEQINIPGCTMQQLLLLKEWLYQRLCNGDPALGRKGPVCPYSKYSMRKKLFWISPYLKPSTNASEVMEYMMQMMELFVANRVEGNDEVFRTYVVAFPYMSREQTLYLIDETHVLLKPFFIAQGLMVGQFHQDCNIGGVHNAAFMALHSPMPLFVVRNIVLNDYMLLKDDLHYLQAYDNFVKEYHPEDYPHYHQKVLEYMQR